MSDIGQRMKQNYEFPARHWLTRRMPVIVRVDGKAFHTYTEYMEKPFSRHLMEGMVQAAEDAIYDMQGCRAAYIQSDEASFLLTDYDTLTTEPWLGYVQNKLESVTASIFTAEFNHTMNWLDARSDPAYFDARAFNVPREEVCNYFLWRAKDWERNSMSMYCRSFFSHQHMLGKGRADQHEMLKSIGKNWATDLSDQQKNGTWIVDGHRRHDVLPSFQGISDILSPLVYCDEIEVQAL
jgi:tRNA(His) guanylyltransferase